MQPSDEPPRVIQQVELVTTPIVISEHRGQPCWCPNCRRTHYAAVDEDVRRGGLAGPRLTALVAYLKGGCHCSYSTIRKFLRDVHRRDELDAEAFALELEDACNELLGAAKFQVPRTSEAQNLARRFWKHGESYIRFLTTPDVHRRTTWPSRRSALW